MSTALDCLRELRAIKEEMSAQRILYGITLTSISTVSFVMNMLLLFVILFSGAVDRFFRLYLLSATFGGLVAVVPIFSALSPAILFDIHLYDPINVIISATDTLGYLTLMITTTAIACDRFVFFLLPEMHKRLTSTDMIFPCFAAFPWIVTVIIIIHMAVIGCYKRTDPFALTFTYSCSICSYYGPLLHYTGFVLPAINFVFYSIVFCRIVALRHGLRSNAELSHTAHSMRKREVSLVVQFSLICLLQFGSSSFFYLLPPLTSNAPVSFYVSMVFSAMNTMVNPIVIFLFQKRIREACLRMFRRPSPVGERVTPDRTTKSRHDHGEVRHS